MTLPDLLDVPISSHTESHSAAEVELVEIARAIRVWQEAARPKLSDEAMLRSYPGLGSTKTYRRLHGGDTDGLVAGKHLPKYRGVWAVIEVASGANGLEEIYEDLTPTLECSSAVAGLIPQRGMTRLVMIEGPTGSGKSKALGVIARKYAGMVAVTEAHEGWQSLACALGDILLALGAETKREDLPSSKGDRLSLVIDNLSKNRRLLLIDEGHHATAAVLNALKTILNRTDSLIVLAGVDTLWRKLTARNWEEARQLIHNRAFERVRLVHPDTDDVVRFLSRRLKNLASGDFRTAAAKISVMSQHSGHYAFLRRIAESLNGQPDAADAAAMLEVAAHIKANLETR